MRSCRVSCSRNHHVAMVSAVTVATAAPTLSTSLSCSRSSPRARRRRQPAETAPSAMPMMASGHPNPSKLSTRPSALDPGRVVELAERRQRPRPQQRAEEQQQRRDHRHRGGRAPARRRQPAVREQQQREPEQRRDRLARRVAQPGGEIGPRSAVAGVLVQGGGDRHEQADEAEVAPDAAAGEPRPDDREREPEHEESEAADTAQEVLGERAVGAEREQHQPGRRNDHDQDQRRTHSWRILFARRARGNGTYTDRGCVLARTAIPQPRR